MSKVKLEKDICEMCELGRNMFSAYILYCKSVGRKPIQTPDMDALNNSRDFFFCKCSIAERAIWDKLKRIEKFVLNGGFLTEVNER